MAMGKSWIVSVRLDDTTEFKRRIDLLTEHAFLKYNPPGERTTGGFLRFLVDYYFSHEIRKTVIPQVNVVPGIPALPVGQVEAGVGQAAQESGRPSSTQ